MKGKDQVLSMPLRAMMKVNDEKVDDNLFIMVMLAHKEMVTIGY
jgi:hypothetical protein